MPKIIKKKRRNCRKFSKRRSSNPTRRRISKRRRRRITSRKITTITPSPAQNMTNKQFILYNMMLCPDGKTCHDKTVCPDGKTCHDKTERVSPTRALKWVSGAALAWKLKEPLMLMFSILQNLVSILMNSLNVFGFFGYMTINFIYMFTAFLVNITQGDRGTAVAVVMQAFPLVVQFQESFENFYNSGDFSARGFYKAMGSSVIAIISLVAAYAKSPGAGAAAQETANEKIPFMLKNLASDLGQYWQP